MGMAGYGGKGDPGRGPGGFFLVKKKTCTGGKMGKVPGAKREGKRREAILFVHEGADRTRCELVIKTRQGDGRS